MKIFSKEESKKNLINNNDKSGETLNITWDLRDSYFLGNNKSKCQILKDKLSTIPFSLYFLIILIILAFSIIGIYINIYQAENPNFKIFDRHWISPIIDDRNYESYLFDNGLEVMLIQDINFDRDGGAIVIENGYLDNPYDEGLSVFANYLLSHLNFDNKEDILTDYFGNYLYETDSMFTTFRFDVLNNGFKKYLKDFSSVLDFKGISEFDFENKKDSIISEIEADIDLYKKYMYYRENHLLEYLVYDFKNENNTEILPEGNVDKLRKINLTQIMDYINNLIDPSKIKIVLFSKYKFLITSKYMKHYFKYLTSKNKINDMSDNDKNNISDWRNNITFNKSQIIYMDAYDYESNTIKIVYFIDKVANESYSELNYKQYYFNYISDFINKKKNNTLYSYIKRGIKQIDTEVEVILKSKIKFSIIVELTSLKNINNIIYLIYKYINKIIKETDEKKLQLDRYKELSDICRIDQNLTENSFSTIDLAANNAKGFISRKYSQKNYWYYYCVPWDNSVNYNETILYNEVFPYFKQLKPENSIVIIAIRDKDKKDLTCNISSYFNLNCENLKNTTKNTKYYDIKYNNEVFNSNKLEQNLNKDNSTYFNITYEKNIYKTEYDQPKIRKENENNIINITKNNNSSLNGFYFKRNVNFYIEKVLIKFNLYHPYLRPHHEDKYKEKCNYLLILELFSAIKRKINEVLYDAILAKNSITFGQTENCLYILVYCFSDQAFIISKIIKNIIYDTDWKSDFFENKEIYESDAINDFLIFDKSEIYEISKFYFKCALNNNLYNKYEFFPDEFNARECDYDKDILNYLNNFIIEGYIYGYFTREEADVIYELFNANNTKIIANLIDSAGLPISAGTFIKWSKNITNLNINAIKETINEKIYNKSLDGNIGFSYRIFNDDVLDISIFQNIISTLKKKENSKLIGNELLAYKYYFLELVFIDDSNNTIPNEDLVFKEWDDLLSKESLEVLNKKVDRIGTRYYYLIKNYYITLDKKQTSLYEKGNSEINEYDYKEIVLDPEQILEQYNKKYKDKIIKENELEETFNYYKNEIRKSKRIDIFTK